MISCNIRSIRPLELVGMIWHKHGSLELCHWSHVWFLNRTVASVRFLCQMVLVFDITQFIEALGCVLARVVAAYETKEWLIICQYLIEHCTMVLQLVICWV